MKVLHDEKIRLALDKKDWRILNSLIKNSRESISKISKDCQISRNSVEYRISQMKKKGLITGFKTIVDISKLGYTSYHVFLGINSKKDESNFLEIVKNSPHVNAIISYRGKFNFEISIMVKNLNDFLSIYYDLTKDISIFNEEIFILLKNIKSEVLPYKFFKKNIEFKPSLKFQIKNNSPEYKIDEIDLNLLKILSNDSNLTNVDIAKKLNISIDIARYRIKKLIDSNYIIEFRPAINYNILNLEIKTILLKLNNFIENQKDFELFLRENENIIWATNCFGSFNYIIYVLTDNLDDFHILFDTIKDKFGKSLDEYELLIANKEYKYSFMADSIKLLK